MSLFSNDDLKEEILLQVGDYLGPSPTKAPSGLNANVPTMIPTLPQTSLATAGSKGNLAMMHEPARDHPSLSLSLNDAQLAVIS